MKNSETQAAVKKFKQFHGHQPEKVSQVSIPYPKALVFLGVGVAIEYRSDKIALALGKGRKTRVYRHKLGAGVKIYTDPKGKALYVIGGKFHVTDWMRD